MIDEGVIKWIVNFLKARKYRVRVNGLMAVTQAGIMSLVESHKAAFWDQLCL